MLAGCLNDAAIWAALSIERGAGQVDAAVQIGVPALELIPAVTSISMQTLDQSNSPAWVIARVSLMRPGSRPTPAAV